MSTTVILRKLASTRYIFLLSGLSFVLWSLAVSVVPKASTLSALLQMDLDQSVAETTHETHASPSDASTQPNDLDVRPLRGIGIAHAHIYVISLADRQDRREQMEFLRTTQDLTWTVVDAVPRNATLVSRILEWVAFRRVEGEKMGPSGFRWPEEINALSVSHSTPLNSSGSDAWAETSPSTKPRSGESGSSRVPCATEDDAVPTLTNDTPEWMILSRAKIACWHSHVSTIRRFVDRHDVHGHRRQNDVAVILEDDIDMEKDISARLSRVWTFLPAGWDIVFLGHCWSNESYYPSLTSFSDMNLHPSYNPKCTHAYALSLSGARRLLQHLRYPPFAYSRALDQAYAWLIQSGRLRSYSMVPSLVVQRKRGHSDISAGSGSVWKESLQDGVFDTPS